MFEEGNIIYFTPYYFPNRNSAPKAKYFVVLKLKGEDTILAALPTSKDQVPEKDEIEQGCVELPNINFNCFVISNNTTVTECGKSFSRPTFIYGSQISTHEISLLNNLYQIEGVDYTIFGKMEKNIFEDLILCLKTSRTVKRKYKRML